MLSEEDRKLLEKWKTMQTKTTPAQPPTMVGALDESSNDSDTHQSAVPVHSVPAQGHTQNTNILAQQKQPLAVQGQGQQTTFMGAGSELSQVVPGSQPNVFSNVPFNTNPLITQPLTQPQPYTGSDEVFPDSDISELIRDIAETQPATQSLDIDDTMPFMSYGVPNQVPVPMNNTQSMPGNMTRLPPTYREALQSLPTQDTSISNTDLPDLIDNLPQANVSALTQKDMTFSNMAGIEAEPRIGAHTTSGSVSDDSPPLPAAPASSPQVAGQSVLTSTTSDLNLPPPQTPSSQQQLPANWLSVVTQRMSRSHIEDLTLAQTPKGTGAGYGLGVDIDAILRETAIPEVKESER